MNARSHALVPDAIEQTQPKSRRRVDSIEGSRDLTPAVSDLIPGFLEYLRVEEQRSPGTLLRYRSHLAGFIAAAGDCRVGAINDDKLSLYKRRLMDRGLSVVTIAAILSGLRSFLRYVTAICGWPTYDPERVRRPRLPRREVEYLTKPEVQRFVEAIPLGSLPGLRDRALAEALCATGMRISEALALNRSDIDWEAKEARIIGKGNKQRRVYFTGRALDWLVRYLAYRHDENPALFTAQGLEPRRLRAAGIWKQFRRHAVRAGLTKRVYPHMLRHTMATTLLANGCPIGHIQNLLGHEHLTTTCRYYLGLISDAEAKAAHGKYLAYEPSPAEMTSGKVGQLQGARCFKDLPKAEPSHY
jgi:integrase/recombinase XerD